MPLARTILLLLCLAVGLTAGAQQYSSDNRKAVRQFEKAQQYLQQSDASRAEQALAAALEADPAFAEAHLSLGDLLFDQRRYSDAVAHYDRFLQLDQRHKRWRADAERNKTRGEDAIISADDSPVTVCVIPTDEELMIATDTMNLL